MRMLQLLRRFSLPLAALLCLMLSACEEPPTGSGPAGNEAISGVLNDEQGYIVPSAIVEAVNGANTRIAVDTTDESGSFALTGLPAELGSLRLRVSHADFRPFTKEVRDAISDAGGKQGVLLNLLHADSCCARLTVAVTNVNGESLSGVEVRLRRGEGQDLVTKGMTGDNGTVTFENVCQGKFNLRLSKQGYAVAERGGINVEGCDTTRLEFTMRPNGDDKKKEEDSCCNGVLTIIPRDSAENNAIISGVHVQIKREGGNTRNVVSNGDGAIFKEVCKGVYHVRMHKEGNPGYKVIEFKIEMGCNDTVTTERWMTRQKKEEGDSCCNGKAIVMVRDSAANNALLNGATVKLWKGNQMVGSRTTENGRAVFEKLCKGVYQISILKEGYKSIEFNIEVGCNQVIEITKNLTRNGEKDTCCDGRVTVNVKDAATNLVLKNAKVRIWKGGALLATKLTSENGAVTFEDLCKGNYGVDILADGYKAIEFQITLECNQALEVNKSLTKSEGGGDTCCNGAFKFRVKDSTVADGGWLSGVKVVIKKGEAAIGDGVTNGDGVFIRQSVCGKSTYTITFSKDGFKEKTITIEMRECRNVEETIRLAPN